MLTVFSLSFFLMLSHEEKLNGLTKKLEAAISDRDSLNEIHQAVRQEMEEVKAELALTQAK